MGRVVFQGKVPSPRPLRVTKDHHVFGQRPVDESLVVGPGRGLANVVVLLKYLSQRESPLPEQAAAPAVLHIRQGRFEPRIVVVRVGQQLQIANHDPVPHNPDISLPGGGVQWIGSPLERVPCALFRRGSSAPVPVVCYVHPWMKGYVVVSPHPWVAVTGQDGRFELKSIPAGTWRVRLWHETGGFLSLPGWLRQGKRVTIRAGRTTRLGTIAVPGERLLR